MIGLIMFFSKYNLNYVYISYCQLLYSNGLWPGTSVARFLSLRYAFPLHPKRSADSFSLHHIQRDPKPMTCLQIYAHSFNDNFRKGVKIMQKVAGDRESLQQSKQQGMAKIKGTCLVLGEKSARVVEQLSQKPLSRKQCQ
jgi:hypothetical protein